VADRVGVHSDVDRLLACGAHALEILGDRHEGRAHFEDAFDRAERLGDAERLAHAAIGLGGLWVHEQRTAAGAASLHARLRRALTGVDPGSALGLRLRARLAGEADYGRGDHADVIALLEEARAFGDPVAIADVVNIAHYCVLGPGHGPVRRQLAAELVELSVHTRRRKDHLLGLTWQAVDMLLDGDHHAQRRLNELKADLTEDDHLAIGFVVDAIDVMMRIRAGHLDEAETLAHACAKRGAAAGDVDAAIWHAGQIVAIRWFQGRIGELVPMLTDLLHSPSISAVDNSLFAALAVAAATNGDKRSAAEAVGVLNGRDLGRLPRSSSWLVTMHGLIEAAYLLDDSDAAARAYQALAPYADLPMVANLGNACFGSTHHALGTAAASTGDLDTAIVHLREAVRYNMGLNHWPALISSRIRYADLLERRGDPEDHAVAQAQRAAAEAARTPTASRRIAGAGARSGGGRPTPASCVRQGQQWRIDWGAHSIMIGHSVGMLHLAVLINNPGQEVKCIDLLAGLDLVGRRHASGGSAQPVLDGAAVMQYRERLHRLAADIEERQAEGDTEAAARAREERDWLLRELSAATGIGGRPRSFSDSAERARTAVGKAIRRALGRIGEADAHLGRHLRESVHTGVLCSYRPT
jgi:hypothetical protein